MWRLNEASRPGVQDILVIVKLTVECSKFSMRCTFLGAIYLLLRYRIQLIYVIVVVFLSQSQARISI